MRKIIKRIKRKPKEHKFQQKIELLTPSKSHGRYSSVFLDIVMFFLFMTASIWCFITGMEVEVRPFILTGGILFFAVLLYSIVNIRKYMKFTIPIYILINSYMIYQFRYMILQGFYCIANRFVEMFNEYYESNLMKYFVDEIPQDSNITIFLLFVLSWVMLLFSIIRWNRHRKILSFVWGLALVVLPIFLGKLPESIWFGSFAIISIAIIGGGAKKTKGHTNVIQAKATALLLCIGTAAAFLIMIVFSPEDYEKTVYVTDMKETMQTSLTDFSKSDFFNDSFLEELLPFGDGVASGGLNNGKLGRADQVIFSKETSLIVKVPETMNQRTYLRGFVGAEYLSNSWKQLSKEDQNQYDGFKEKFKENGLSIENIGTSLAKQMGSPIKMEIENVNTGKKSSFVPYETKETISISKKGRLNLEGEKKNKKYSVEYFPYISADTVMFYGPVYNDINTSEEVGILEEEYMDFVYQVYTKVPAVDQQIIDLFEFAKMSGDYGYGSIYDRIQLVIMYLSGTTEYNLSPGMLPQGEDFVNYFLFENRKGYCTHYASAATILLRYMGIPSRYVEGYVISDYDIKKGTVSKKDGTRTMKLLDSNAHAWVEVYFNHFGWVPFEVTPGYGGISSIPEEIRNQIENPYKPNANGQMGPNNTIPQNVKPTPTVPSNQTVGKGKSSSLKNNSGMMEVVFQILQILGMVFILILLTMLGGFMRHIYWLIQRKRIQQSNDYRRIVLFFSKQLDQLLGRYGLGYQGEPNEEYVNKVEMKFHFLKRGVFQTVFSNCLKAGFSDLEITKEQASNTAEFYDRFCMEIAKESPLGRKVILRIFGNYS